MKKYFSFVFVAAALLFASTAQAQELRVKANIPFDFVVGNTVYSAGTYTIGPALHSTNAMILEGPDARNIVMPIRCSSTLPSKTTVLLFDRMGDTYFLNRIWVEGRTDGREFPKSKAELQLAKTHTPTDNVTIAAQLIR